MALNKLLTNKIGTTANSFMKTVKIINNIATNRPYKLIWDELWHIEELCGGRIKGKIISINKPKSVLVKVNNNGNNMITEIQNIEIPIEIATNEKLAYYGCQLVEMMDIITFNSKENQTLYYCQINIGDEYLDNYIMNENFGNGVYFESYNHPTFYSATYKNSGGFIILVKPNGMFVELTGFIIPYESGINIPENVLHSNCFLKGLWKTIYSNKTDNTSNYVIGKNHKPVKFIYKN
jgi:hypothetical protein